MWIEIHLYYLKNHGTNENALLFYVGEASKNANLAMELSK